MYHDKPNTTGLTLCYYLIRYLPLSNNNKNIQYIFKVLAYRYVYGILFFQFVICRKYIFCTHRIQTQHLHEQI